jgi:hypothetical protein
MIVVVGEPLAFVVSNHTRSWPVVIVEDAVEVAVEFVDVAVLDAVPFVDVLLVAVTGGTSLAPLRNASKTYEVVVVPVDDEAVCACASEAKPAIRAITITSISAK